MFLVYPIYLNLLRLLTKSFLTFPMLPFEASMRMVMNLLLSVKGRHLSSKHSIASHTDVSIMATAPLTQNITSLMAVLHCHLLRLLSTENLIASVLRV